MSTWSPKRSLPQVEALLTAPGSLHELQTTLVDGQVQRVYKKLWPSLRVFWIWAANEHKDAVYTVFENQRPTFGQVFDCSLRAAALFYDVYGIRKGDRVTICSRNYPEFLTAFWACHLIGAVSVLANAWSPIDVLTYCFARTDSKLIILDSERASTLEPLVNKISASPCNGILVLEAHEGKGSWNGMKSWSSALEEYKGDYRKILKADPGMLPEDNATILFTSGTTGLPKGVLSTQRQFLSNVLNVPVGGKRAALRRGEDAPAAPIGPQKGVLCAVPLFHVTGLTSLAIFSTMIGLKFVMMRKWDAEEGARLIKAENVAVAGGVPSMVADLTDSTAVGAPLDGVMFGGAPAPDLLAKKARQAFPTASVSQGYGLTETSSVAVGFAGEDYIARPTSCGLPMPINDVLIMDNNVACLPGKVGEVWIRGPNVMKGYWKDADATAKVLTKDGWFKSGDLGCLDEEGFLYILDRIKDIIIRGGENIDSVSVENALYADERVLEVAAVGIPDKRLGELVAAIVSTKPGQHGNVAESSLVALAAKRLPKFAVPVMIVIQAEPFERTPSGKILKPQLRKQAAKAWAERQNNSSKVKL